MDRYLNISITRLQYLFSRGWRLHEPFGSLHNYLYKSIDNKNIYIRLTLKYKNTTNGHVATNLLRLKNDGCYFAPYYHYMFFTIYQSNIVKWLINKNEIRDDEITQWLDANNLSRPMNKSTQVLFRLAFE